jgi:predicted nucleic acid-binding protein
LAADTAAYVFDSCAVVALLYREPGAERAASLLESKSRCLIHAVNVCEVFYDGLRRGSTMTAEELETLLVQAGLRIETAIPRALWQTAGQLKADIRRISLADCFAAALALREGADLVTTDHHEFDPVAESGLLPVLFIR